jgi:hypothetical protein
MSINILPITGMDIIAYPGAMIQGNCDFGAPIFWISFSSNPSWYQDSDVAELLSYRGFIKTTPTAFSTSYHDCDNLQVDGVVRDLRLLTDIKVQPMTDYPDFVVPHIPINNVYYPAPIIVEHGTEYLHYFTGTDHVSAVVCFVTTEDGGFAVAKWNISGNGYYPSRYGLTVSLYRYRYNSYNNTYSLYATVKVCNDICYKKYNMDTVNEVLLPYLRRTLASTPYTKMTNLHTNAWFFSQHVCTGLSKVDFCSDYLNKMSDWTTALDNFTKREFDFGENHYAALCKIDTITNNGIAYLKDAKEFINSVKSILLLLHGSVSAKNLADLFLSVKYGFLATYSDTKDYMEFVSSAPKIRSGVSATQLDFLPKDCVKAVTTIRYHNDTGLEEDIYNFFRSFDLLVNPANLWELIPFSFVVDWFTPIGNILNRLDQIDHLTHLLIDCVFDSLTIDLTIPAARFMPGTSGNIHCHRYIRHCDWTAEFPLIVPNQPSLTSHFLDGAALIIQRLCK